MLSCWVHSRTLSPELQQQAEALLGQVALEMDGADPESGDAVMPTELDSALAELVDLVETTR